ncbi:alpha-N-arabinofuranosidase [Sphingomonas sp. QA11]|uniref:alpha-N-arabinofuranosidase n=1 Tax=Sphingomonas sp. QA11 TaxID=2950605 RepID=UPI00234A9E53|nr:alpha-L-arabinofuranosidase C-terminal domain-containing protein [Sphingomonas sp. QA11]WCM27031.1 alpha-N-arabinofuranosidase [Sphingomonas sp. QA11]
MAALKRLRTGARIALAAALVFASGVAWAQGREASVTIHADKPGPKVQREIFGQFAEHLGTGIYGGLWVGRNSRIPNSDGFRNDVIAALRAIKVPLIRWPGGCFADEYHWREGVGAKRPVKVNTHWGGVTEPNSVGTHEFMNFTEMVGAEAYVSGNVGSGSPQEMADWVEYMTSPTASTLANERRANGRKEPWKLPYFGLGNELWGCGGNMHPDYAANETRRYATFVKAPANTKILKIASGASDSNYNWTEVMMRDAGDRIDGLGVHYYTVPDDWKRKGSATGFDEASWARTLSKTLLMDEYVTKHSAVMDKYDPERRVWLAVDEWGTWYDPTPGSNPGFLQQQNSLRDALVAAINLNIFTRHAERVKMANIAQMINVLQAMILTDGDKMVVTPTYQVFGMYVPWQDATQLPVDQTSPWYNKDQWTMASLNTSAVRGADGAVHVSLANLDPVNALTVTLNLDGGTASTLSGKVLTADRIDAHNRIGEPLAVAPRDIAAVPVTGGKVVLTLPAKSVTVVALK